MEISSDVITEFFSLKKSKKFNVIIAIFSTIISGFVIVLSIKPEYLKDFSTFKIILLSVSLITPIYLFNQALSVILVSLASKLAIKKLIGFAKLPEDLDSSVEEFSWELANNIAWKAIYNSPARQTAEITTIISSYLSAFIGWQFNFGLIKTYLTLAISSILVMYAIYWFIFSTISLLEPKHLKPFVEKTKNDEDFKALLKETIDGIRNITKKKKEKNSG